MREGGQISVTAETRKGRSHPGSQRRSSGGLSLLGELVRRHDRDRYQTALFAPAGRREALFALYAFNYEIARVRESVTQPMLGQIRLQWWREVIDAAYAGAVPRRHEVAEPLTAAIREFELTRAHFDRMIDAREADLADEPPVDVAALQAYAEATSAELTRLALEVVELSRPRSGSPPPRWGRGVMPRPLLINMPWRSGGNTPTPALPHRGGGRRGLPTLGEGTAEAETAGGGATRPVLGALSTQLGDRTAVAVMPEPVHSQRTDAPCGSTFTRPPSRHLSRPYSMRSR